MSFLEYAPAPSFPEIPSLELTAGRADAIAIGQVILGGEGRWWIRFTRGITGAEPEPDEPEPEPLPATALGLGRSLHAASAISTSQPRDIAKIIARYGPTTENDAL